MCVAFLTAMRASLSTSEAPLEGPPAKRSKRDCKYQYEWKSSGISSSSRGMAYAHCDFCNTDFNVKHGGINDVKKHLSTSKHQQSLSATEAS